MDGICNTCNEPLHVGCGPLRCSCMPSKVEAAKKTEDLTVFLPDTRGTTISRWGRGNLKLGPDVYTFSRLPGRLAGTCPGATAACQDFCYAMRVRGSTPAVWDLWTRNSETEKVPDYVPAGCKLVRFHVSGDFSSNEYIISWIALVKRNPDVKFWGYTRSWRVKELLQNLEILRRQPNVKLYASVDNHVSPPPEGWLWALLEDDVRVFPVENNEAIVRLTSRNDAKNAYVCAEERGTKANCQDCRYCIEGDHGNVVFIKH